MNDPVLTLRWFLNCPEIDNLEFFGDEDCLGNPITGVNVIDNPEGVPWIKKNELVLTTGFIFYKDIALTKKLLKELHDVSCTALCIKIKRFYDTIPQFLIEEAARYRLPLIAVPFYHSYSDIMRVIFRELELRQLSNQAFVINETRKFCQLFTSNSGISSMLSMLSSYTDSIILITDYNDKSVYFHIPDSYANLLQTSSRVVIRPDKSKNAESGKEADSDKEASNTRRFWINKQIIPFAVFPIPSGRYYLCADINAAPLSDDIVSIITNCLPILSTELETIQVNQRRFSSTNHFAPFFSMLSDMRSKSSEEIRIVCNTYAFPYDCKRVCIAYEIQQAGSPERLMRTVYDKFSTALENSGQQYFLSFYNDYVIVFLFFQKSISNLEAVNQAQMTAEYLYQSLDESLRQWVRGGVSRSHSRLVTIGTAFEESLISINMQSHLNPQKAVASYLRQIPYHLLRNLNHHDLNKIYNDTIVRLVDYDQANGTCLVHTLRMYLENRMVIRETSRQLFIHRNTLADHLNLIKRILGTDLEAMDEIFSFYLGLCAYDLLRET